MFLKLTSGITYKLTLWLYLISYILSTYMLTGSPLSRSPSMSPVTSLLQQAQMSPTLQVLTDYKNYVPNLIPNILVDNIVCVCVFVCASVGSVEELDVVAASSRTAPLMCVCVFVCVRVSRICCGARCCRSKFTNCSS